MFIKHLLSVLSIFTLAIYGTSSEINEIKLSNNLTNTLADTGDNYTFFPGCYTNDDIQHTLDINIIVDGAFFMKNDYDIDKTSQSVYEIINVTNNIVYHPQLNIDIHINKITIKTDGMYNTEDTKNCPPQIGDFLDYTFKLGGNENAAHTHILTGCLTGSTSGVSYTDTLCTPHGLSVTKYNGLYTWRIFAHELGHSIGLDHTFQDGIGRTGGLMDYGNGKLLDSRKYGYHPYFSKPKLCQVFTDLKCKWWHETSKCNDCVNKITSLF